MSGGQARERWNKVRELRRRRSRSRFVRWSMAALVALMLASWTGGELALQDTFSERRRVNAVRFLGEIVPYPLRGEPFEVGAGSRWAGGLLERHAGAIRTTLAISIAAVVMAAASGMVLACFAARNVATAQALVDMPVPPALATRAAWAALVGSVRAFMIFVRAVPEYVWAFLLVQLFGYTAWPAVLALALHNAGILGKLTAETLEDADTGAARALRALGAGRAQTVTTALVPQVLPRTLLYFFYRWETCLREATVLGMLGVVSLGSLVRDARASNFYDEMALYVAVGAALVMAGDLASGAARAVVRRAS